ncbi:hypothetical protein [Rhizomonospora bruguierae]|uniref:hypothetical protein n=1 Tax=Rhizomonospora bruguierae TaxID=1581705 RepID=UPI001BCF50CD|nr:hypothetical protein [Micromonospora sp. NBRC 107566]
MTNPGGRLWVDPEGVVTAGDAYAEHAALYDSHLRQLAVLRERYGQSWGDDEMGTQFSAKFLAGLANLEGLIKGVKGTLDYVAEGLGSSGRLYRKADDEATEVAHKMAGNLDEHLRQGSLHRHRIEEGDLVSRHEDGQTLRVERHGKKRLFKKLLPMDQGIRTEAESSPGAPTVLRVARVLQTQRLRPVVSATSAAMMKREYRTARVNSVPLAEGYHLASYRTFPDGTARLDLNLYDSVVPASQLTVTTVDGHPITPEADGLLFVVKENTDVDPTAPGYQPLYVSFTPDGTPTALGLGRR